jgi:hypothetical protein
LWGTASRWCWEGQRVVSGGADSEGTLKKEEEDFWRGRKKKFRKKYWFFTNFTLSFLLLEGMESIPIYRGWKRDALSLLETNLGPWFKPERSQPSVQSGYHGLSNFDNSGLLELATLGQRQGRCGVNRPKNHTEV